MDYIMQFQCELERSSILYTLRLSLESSRLTGYILTQNGSMFFETNGNVARLYHCPKFYSPLQLMDRYYIHTTIMYKENIQLVDPITRQHFSRQTYKTVPINIYINKMLMMTIPGLN